MSPPGPEPPRCCGASCEPRRPEFAKPDTVTTDSVATGSGVPAQVIAGSAHTSQPDACRVETLVTVLIVNDNAFKLFPEAFAAINGRGVNNTPARGFHRELLLHSRSDPNVLDV